MIPRRLHFQGPGGTSGITPTGGVGGSAGYRVDFSNFFITVGNSLNPAFVGDYSQFDSVTLSADVRVDSIIFFFQQVSRPWFVELRSTKLAQGNYPWTSVWFKFAEISAANHGNWTNFSVTIDDTSSATLPTGWRGYGDEDPNTFEPILPAGITFADVLANVDEIVFSTAEPGFFFGQTEFDITLDNLSIETTGGPWDDRGNGLAGATGTPQLFGGGTLQPNSPTTIGLTNAAPFTPAMRVIGLSEVNFPLLGGTLVPSSDLPLKLALTDAFGTLPLNVNWPVGIPAGVDLYWQYWVADPTGPQGWTASNGLRSTTP